MNVSKRVNSNRCLPWNFPSADTGMPPCRPVERRDFLREFRHVEMSKVIGTEVCLPDCGGTEYDVSISTAPFRRCDQANMGLSLLCRVDTPVKPQKWGDMTRAEYKEKSDNGELPGFIKVKGNSWVKL